MNTGQLISVLGLALTIASARAGTVPLLSGKYATNYNQTCQAVQSTGSPGSTSQEVFVSDFDSVTGTFHVQGDLIYGGLAVWPGIQEGMYRDHVINNGTFSNTETTVTFFGTLVDGVAYGPVKNGIAQSLVLNSKTSAGCAVSIILSRY